MTTASQWDAWDACSRAGHAWERCPAGPWVCAHCWSLPPWAWVDDGNAPPPGRVDAPPREAAAPAVEKKRGPKPGTVGQIARNAEIVRRRLAGESPSVLAVDYGVSPSRVSQLTARAQREAVAS